MPQAHPRLTREGRDRLEERLSDIRDRRLPDLRPMLVDTERDERVVAEFERLLEEASALEVLLAQAEVIEIDPASAERIELGMRVQVAMADGSTPWVRPVHPDEAFLDDERISATSPLALALLGAGAGDSVEVLAPTGAWSCQVLALDLTGVTPGD